MSIVLCRLLTQQPATTTARTFLQHVLLHIQLNEIVNYRRQALQPQQTPAYSLSSVTQEEEWRVDVQLISPPAQLLSIHRIPSRGPRTNCMREDCRRSEDCGPLISQQNTEWQELQNGVNLYKTRYDDDGDALDSLSPSRLWCICSRVARRASLVHHLINLTQHSLFWISILLLTLKS